MVTEVTCEQMKVPNIDSKQYIASGQPHNNVMQWDGQHKNPQTLSYCLEAFSNCTNCYRYGENVNIQMTQIFRNSKNLEKVNLN